MSVADHIGGNCISLRSCQRDQLTCREKGCQRGVTEVGCPDGGACHHECAQWCWRVSNAGPLSGVYPGDDWPSRPMAPHVKLATRMPTSVRPPLPNEPQRTLEQIGRDILKRAETMPKPNGLRHKGVPKTLLDELEQTIAAADRQREAVPPEIDDEFGTIPGKRY